MGVCVCACVCAIEHTHTGLPAPCQNKFHSQRSSLLDQWERDGALAWAPGWLEGDIVHEHQRSDAVHTAPGSQLTSAIIQQQWPVSKVSQSPDFIGWELPIA